MGFCPPPTGAATLTICIVITAIMLPRGDRESGGPQIRRRRIYRAEPRPVSSARNLGLTPNRAGEAAV